MRIALSALLALALASCADPNLPYVRYQGTNSGRKKSVEEIEVLRIGPPRGRFQDIGTVVVVCPGGRDGGGCNYEGALNLACIRAAANGADGIHTIEAPVNAAGNVVNLRASAFVRLPPIAKPAEAKGAATNVEDRLRQLDELRDKGLITPEEYASKRKAILDGI